MESIVGGEGGEGEGLRRRLRRNRGEQRQGLMNARGLSQACSCSTGL
jgi:hypothetical protein